MDKEKALKNQGSEFRKGIGNGGGGEKLVWIDYVKGISCIFIVLVHFNNRFAAPAFKDVFASGGRGVDVFFIISAYLAFRSLYKMNSESSIFDWFRKKIVRLAPLYYLSLILSLFFYRNSGGGVEYWLGSHTRVSVWNILFHVLFLHGLNPYYADSIIGVEWYLGTLVILFCITPIIHKYVTGLKRSIVAFCMSYIISKIAVKGLLFIIVTKGLPDQYLWEHYIGSFSIFAVLPGYILGVVLFYLTNSKKVEALLRNKVMRAIVLISCIIVLFLACYNPVLNRSEVWWICFISILLSLNYVEMFIGRRIFSTIGKYSYGIYLLHYLIISKWNLIDFTSYSFANWLLNLLAIFICAILLSFLYRKIEDRIELTLEKRRRI